MYNCTRYTTSLIPWCISNFNFTIYTNIIGVNTIYNKSVILLFNAKEQK